MSLLDSCYREGVRKRKKGGEGEMGGWGAWGLGDWYDDLVCLMCGGWRGAMWLEIWAGVWNGGKGGGACMLRFIHVTIRGRLLNAMSC